MTENVAEKAERPKLVPVSDKQTIAPVKSKLAAKKKRTVKKIKKAGNWVWLVAVPFLMCCIYYGAIVSDRFVSETKVVVKNADSAAPSEMGLPVMGTPMAPGGMDAQLVKEYVLSLDMLTYLDEHLGIREHYQSDQADVFSRVWQSATREQFLQFYRDHVEVIYDDLSGILSIRVQAFDPEYAQQLLQAMVERAELFINRIGHQMAEEQVHFSQQELQRAQQQLRDSKQDILHFQDANQLFSPEEESVARLTLVNELEAELTRARVDLKSMLSYMNEDYAQVISQKDLIAALESQLAVERAKLVGDSQQEQNLNDINAKFADLRLSVEFATDIYKTSLLSLEQSRLDAYQKLKYLVVVDSPNLAESAEYPRKLYDLTTILVVLSMLYGVVMIVLATIREHRDM